MRADHGKTPSGLLPAALLAIVASLTGVAGAVKLAQTAVNWGPGVGDMISFDPSAVMSDDLQPQTVVARNGERECMLDLDTLHKRGGSLVIETRVPGNPPRYQVHWAGKRSSPGQYDCGTSAELTLDSANLDMLAMAAGGWGPMHQPLIHVSFPAWAGRT
jgi:hypothetical protein